MSAVPDGMIERAREIAARDALARAFYDRWPFYMPGPESIDGHRTATRFDWDAAPAYHQAECYEKADVALEALAALQAAPSPEGLREALRLVRYVTGLPDDLRWTPEFTRYVNDKCNEIAAALHQAASPSPAPMGGKRTFRVGEFCPHCGTPYGVGCEHSAASPSPTPGAELRQALAAYDAKAATCPLLKKAVPGHIPCPLCKAKGDQGCGVEGIASTKFIAAVRSLVSEAQQ